MAAKWSPVGRLPDPQNGSNKRWPKSKRQKVLGRSTSIKGCYIQVISLVWTWVFESNERFPLKLLNPKPSVLITKHPLTQTQKKHPNASCQKSPLLRRCSPKYYSSSKLIQRYQVYGYYFSYIRFDEWLPVSITRSKGYIDLLQHQGFEVQPDCECIALATGKVGEIHGEMGDTQRFISQEKGDANLQDMKNWRLQICQSDSFLIPTRLLQTLRAAARVFSGKKTSFSNSK